MPPPARLKIEVETLRARGHSVVEISAILGMNLEYARKLLHERYDLVSLYDQYAPTAEDNQRHLDRCQAEGGFPACHRIGDDTVWITQDFTPWRHLKAERRAA